MVRSPAAACCGLPTNQGSRSALFVVTLVVPGSVIGTGASTLRGSATARAEARSELIRQIDAARSTHDGRAARVAAPTAEMSRAMPRSWLRSRARTPRDSGSSPW